MKTTLFLLGVATGATVCDAWTPEVSRSTFFRSVAAVATGQLLPTPSAVAADHNKISDAQLKDTVTSDILDKKFLVTGNISREVYRPTATFTDEIDTYGLEQWVKGTQKLFVGDKSTLRLVGDVDVNKERVEFRFDEDLMFNIPFNPVVSLTGKVVLARDAEGFITSYQEFWDQDVWTVVRSAKF